VEKFIEFDRKTTTKHWFSLLPTSTKISL